MLHSKPSMGTDNIAVTTVQSATGWGIGCNRMHHNGFMNKRQRTWRFNLAWSLKVEVKTAANNGVGQHQICSVLCYIASMRLLRGCEGCTAAAMELWRTTVADGSMIGATRSGSGDTTIAGVVADMLVQQRCLSAGLMGWVATGQ